MPKDEDIADVIAYLNRALTEAGGDKETAARILGVTPADLAVVFVVTIAVAVFIALFYKQLLFMTFDPDVAPIFGMRTGRVDALFALALAATIVASINVVGVTLIAATLIIPATTEEDVDRHSDVFAAAVQALFGD